MIMRTIALLLVLTARSALGEIPDQPLTPPVIGAAPARQESARVASDGTNFFAVWRTRTASNMVVLGGGRLSPAGELLDRPSIFLAAGRDSTLGDPDVVFVGGTFLVAYRSGSSVVTRCFSRYGTPLYQPVVIGNSGMHAWLATNGTTVFLATRPNRFRLLADDGTPLGPEKDIPNVSSSWMGVASNGERYLVAAKGLLVGGVAVLFSGNGDYLAEQQLPFSVSDFQGEITAASNGSTFLVIASVAISVFVDAEGHPGALQTIDKRGGRSVTASWSGGEYTVVWARTLFYSGSGAQDIAGVRVNAAGVSLDVAPVVITSLQLGNKAAVFGSASNGRDTMIITSDVDIDYMNSRTTAAIFTSLPQIDAEPASRRRAPIASSAIEQAGGSIASNGTLSLVTRRERSGLEPAIVRGAFVAADGQVGAPFFLGDADPLTPTATASNGRDFVVVYVDPLLRLVAQRVMLEGVLDAVPIVIATYSPSPYPFRPVYDLAAGWSGKAYVVASAGYVTAIAGINPDGTVNPFPQPTFASDPSDTPAVSCGGNGCSVTWHRPAFICTQLCPTYPSDSDFVTHTDGAGKVISEVMLADSPGITPARSLAAADGTSTFVYSNGTTMLAGRITAAGVALETLAGRRVMTSETSFALQPVTAVGHGLYFIEPDDAMTGRLYWARIDSEPAPHVTSLVNLHESISIPVGFSESRNVPLTASARNTYLLYSRGEDDATLMAPRLFLRTLASPDPQPSPVRRRAAR